jgi:hypothetical protein
MRWKITAYTSLAAFAAGSAVAFGAVTTLSGSSISDGPAGIKGAAFIGPLCAVPPPGHKHCSGGMDVRPYRARVKIMRLSDGHVFKVTTPNDGRFFVTLAPGRYRVRALRRKQEAMPPPARVVVVEEHTVSDVILDYDNGMA